MTDERGSNGLAAVLSRATALLAVLALAALGLVATPLATPAGAVTATSLKVLDWNVQGGQGTDGVIDFDRIISVIKQENPDVITLQELHDNSNIGGDNQWQLLLDAFPGYYAHYARSDDNAYGGSAGNLIVSKYPILEKLTYLLPQYPADTTAVRRSLGGARINVGGTDVRIYTTHLSPGLGTEATERRNRQAQAVIDKMPADLMATPMLLTGDFNVRPDDEIRPWFAAAGWLDAWTQVNANTGPDSQTHPGDGDDARIDYTYATPAFDVTSAHTVQTSASDHLPVVTQLTVHSTAVDTAGVALAGTASRAGAAHVTGYTDGSVALRVCDDLADGWGVRGYVSTTSGGTAVLTGADGAYADKCGTFRAAAGTATAPYVRVCLYQGTTEKDCATAHATRP
ncbi:endonuclease/exonuclease/phosphatase family protein [Streptomyces odontomachi]|uniref:endonuclease/exonuclease/phosphatase family protein n=1 Tax=Streptomyces odontomachi TaxID=2944940 RepID=UPI00210D4FAA|nr:endonuclease/exonuclease/phosphatase family protein [Streptomyces sp. ODS25]